MSQSRRGAGRRRSPYQLFIFVAVALIIFLVIVLALTTTWHAYWIWLVAASVITFLLYGYDKGQARLGGLRVPELVLHGLALLGGFPGGWLGRAVFRHKTRRLAFTGVLIASTIIHLGVIYLLFLR
ncbi:MAG: hypothetical protein Kow0063_29520 [Anaerolineae bacterium]